MPNGKRGARRTPGLVGFGRRQRLREKQRIPACLFAFIDWLIGDASVVRPKHLVPLEFEDALARLNLDLLDITAVGIATLPEETGSNYEENALLKAGFVALHPSYWRALRELADRHGIVLVADEVQCGMGRTGKLWAVDHLGAAPDLLATAKSLGSGMPIAAVVGKAEVMDGPHPGGLGGTYSGNPLACAAALATLEEITSEAFLTRSREVGARLRTRLEELATEHPSIGDVRGLGPMLAAEFVKDDAKTPWPELVLEVTKQALARGVIVIRAGLYSNCLRFLPPLNITDEELDEAMAVVGEAIAAAERSLGKGTLAHA